MSTQTPTDLALEEYRALRATIRERGTARLAIATLTFVAWAALAVAVQALFTLPVTTLLPLVVLVAGFEVVCTLHIGVERIGRYLQVYFEVSDQEPPAWEHATMWPGRRAGGAGRGSDPLFSGLFIIAAILNLVPVALMSLRSGPMLLGVPVELLVFGLLHAVFILRILNVRRLAGAQRRRDLEEFQAHHAGRR